MGNYVSYYWYGIPTPPPLPLLTPRRFGWVRDKDDERDHKYLPPEDLIPDTSSLREKMPAVLNQENLGSCTANALANAVRFCEKEERHRNTPESRLFIYYNERALEGTVDKDCGAEIRDGIKTINENGVCAESIWPYDVTAFKIKPPKECYDQARLHKALRYLSLEQNVEHMRTCLNSGFPIIIGFDVFASIDSVETAKTGTVPDPPTPVSGGEGGGGGGAVEKPIGGHCVLLTGYDDNTKRFEFQNSWGKGWGKEGFGTLSYEYMTNPDLASSLWTVRFVE